MLLSRTRMRPSSQLWPCLVRGYRVRCALEEGDSGDIRLDKPVEFIRHCPRGLHHLSRIEPRERSSTFQYAVRTRLGTGSQGSWPSLSDPLRPMASRSCCLRSAGGCTGPLLAKIRIPPGSATGAKRLPVVSDWEPNHKEVARHTQNRSGETTRPYRPLVKAR